MMKAHLERAAAQVSFLVLDCSLGEYEKDLWFAGHSRNVCDLFIGDMLYPYYAALWNQGDYWLLMAIVSLGWEGMAVFVFNDGDWPTNSFAKKSWRGGVAKRAIPFRRYQRGLG